MANTSATVRVRFNNPEVGASAAYSFSAEVDTSLQSSFSPGQTVPILVRSSANVQNISATPSIGSVVNSGQVKSVTDTIDLMFEKSNKASFDLGNSTIVSKTWIGNNLGSTTFADGEVTAQFSGVGVLRVVVSTVARVWNFVGPASSESYAALIVFSADKI